MTAGVPAKLLVTITRATAAFRVAVVTVVAFRIAASCPPQIQPKERLASSSRPIPVQPLSRIPARVSYCVAMISPIRARRRTFARTLGACPNICSCSRMAAGFRWALAFSASAQPCARTITTYVLMRNGFMYLTAVIDWFSRYVLSWRLSNTLEGQFCLEALDEALSMGRPEIFNTDQGSQFTARDYTSRLEEAGIAVSRDGRGRALDNVFVERLWRSVKYEDIYINDYERAPELSRSSECLSHYGFNENDSLSP